MQIGESVIYLHSLNHLKRTTMMTYTINNNRINRNNNVVGFGEICNEILEQIGVEKRFDTNKNGYTMSWDVFSTTLHRKNCNDIRVKIVLNFNTNSANITID